MRIARELHDEVGQGLTAVVLQLERVTRGVRRSGRGRGGARGCARDLEEVREIARRLRPEALDDLGLGSALAALTVDVSRRTRLRIERQVAPGLPVLDPEEELVVYRVAQEALTNVVRHSGAKRARVELRSDDGEVELVGCSDDGAGSRSGGGRGRRASRHARACGSHRRDVLDRIGRARWDDRPVATGGRGDDPLPGAAADRRRPCDGPSRLRLVLDAEPDLRVVAEAGDGAEAVERGAQVEISTSACSTCRCRA